MAARSAREVCDACFIAIVFLTPYMTHRQYKYALSAVYVQSHSTYAAVVI